MDQARANGILTEEKQLVHTSFKNRHAGRLAWILLGLSIILFLIGVVLLLLVPENMRVLNGYEDDYRIGFILLFDSALGTLVAIRHRRNPIGWIMCAIGLSGELQVFAVGSLVYANYNNPNSIHTPLLIFLLLSNLWVTQNALGPMAFLSFPDGRLLSPRWRFFAWFPVFLGVLMYLLSIPAPLMGISQSQFRSPISLLDGNIDSNSLVATTKVIEYLFMVFLIFAAIGIFQRLRQAQGELREQMKWCVYAGVLTVTITTCLSILVNVPLVQALNPGAHNTDMLFLGIPADFAQIFIPISVFIAIYKYRLYEIDLIINRTLVYVPLTAILAGLYSALVTLLQKLFIASTGQKSDAAVVVSTLILATAFTPIKNNLQNYVDRRFKEPDDPLKGLKAYSKQIEAVTEVINTRRTTRRLLEMSIAAFDASGGAIYLKRDGELVMAHASAGWKERDAVLSLPMEEDGMQMGLLMLGARKNQKTYSSDDREALQQAADGVAEILWLNQVDTQVEHSTKRRKNGRSNR